MRASILTAIASFVFIGFGPTSFAQSTVEEACNSFERPNIDCACVASRAAIYERVGALIQPEVPAILIERHFSST